MQRYKNIYTIFQLLCLCFFILGITYSSYAQENKKYRLVYAEAVHFASGSAKIQYKDLKTLDDAIAALDLLEDSYIMINAHTDSVGSYTDNEQLAQERAQAAYDYFINNNIDTSKIQIRAFGEYSPISDDGTASGRAENRRVSIYVAAPWDPDAWTIRSTIAGQVKNAHNGKAIPNAPILVNYLDGRDTVYTNEEGFYEVEVYTLYNVEVRTYAKGFFFVSKLVKPDNKSVNELNFSLEPAILGGKMLLTDLYFHSGTADLLSSSETTLEGLLTFLEINDQLIIEIGGHINKPDHPPVEESSSSFQLSEARAKTVYDYFIKNGIPESRLSYKGYGNWEMIYPEPKTSLQHQTNRRVEFKVVE